MQSSLDEDVERRLASPARYPDGRFDGRGIVVCAGGKRYFTCAWVLITILRKVHRTTLPIQVWHLGRREMSEEMAILLSEEGIEIVDAEAVVAQHPARISGGWPLKPYAMAQCRFREVLLLDADTVPLVDPAAAFAWHEYLDSGLLLWPDRVDIKAANPVWARFGLEPADHASVDSGVLLADKARVWDILDLAVALNEHSDDLYDMIHGDKDTFLLAARLLGRRFGMVRHRPFPLEWDMVQRDPAGEPFVHHRCGGKWFLHLPNRPLAAPALMQACEAALAELRERWSGNVFHPPERSAGARAEERRLIALRRFRYHNIGRPPRDLELLPGGRVGAGRVLEQHWAVIDGENGLLLHVYGDAGTVATLARTGDGSWRGLGCEPGSEIVMKEPAMAGEPGWPDDDRVSRSAREVVAALAQPAWLAIGHEAERASALECALSLVNDAFDDVPEQIAALLGSLRVAAPWHGFLDRLGTKLAIARDQRLALLGPPGRPRPEMLPPGMYARPKR
jgi:hypothetical protein